MHFTDFVLFVDYPSKLYSDNTKTFESAVKEITKLIRSPGLQKSPISQGINWKFITECSPWEGGSWERLIRETKWCIIKVVRLAHLSFHQMSTILTEIEAIINSRPTNYEIDDNISISYPSAQRKLMKKQKNVEEFRTKACCQYAKKRKNVPSVSYNIEVVSFQMTSQINT